MLLINQRLDKLAAARVDFSNRGMLKGSLFASVMAAGSTTLDDNEPSLEITTLEHAGSTLR